MASQWHYNGLDDNNFKLHGHLVLFILLFFSLVLLFTILFLFVRWSCKYRHLAHPPSSSSSSSSATTNTVATADGSFGLEAIVIDNLPILLYRSSMDEEAQCSICLSAFQDQEKVKILPGCNHTFHPECVDKWLSTHSNCPLCRSSLRPDSVDTEKN